MSTDTMPAYVLGLGATGLTMVRSLGRRGVPVTGVHHSSQDPATRSRYCSVKILPRVQEDAGAWLEYLMAQGRGAGPAVLLPTTVAHWNFLLTNRRILERAFRCAWPAGGGLAGWPIGELLAGWARRAGVPAAVDSEIADQSYLLCSYLDRQSDFAGGAVVRVLGRAADAGGLVTLAEAVREPRIAAAGLRVLEAMGHRGFSCLSFTFDAGSGGFAVAGMDLAPPVPLAAVVAAGVDLPVIAYDDLCGELPGRAINPATGRRVMLIEDEAARLGGWRAWLRVLPLLGQTDDVIMAWNDPAPGVASMRRWLWRCRHRDVIAREMSQAAALTMSSNANERLGRLQATDGGDRRTDQPVVWPPANRPRSDDEPDARMHGAGI